MKNSNVSVKIIAYVFNTKFFMISISIESPFSGGAYAPSAPPGYF